MTAPGRAALPPVAPSSGPRPWPALNPDQGLVLFLVGYVAALWLAVAWWMVRDVRRRTSSGLAALLTAALGVLVPVVGVAIYLVLRPGAGTSAEGLPEEEETPAIEDGAVRPCPTCGRELEAEFVVCPYCRTQFARRCRACQRWLRLGWRICPYCAEEVGVPELRGQRRALG